ncbi:MAG: alpha/beta hydrolase [Microcoleus sp. PH2017_10_PVI_O_A]|uniref:alpha/beta hydrolase n=1 Tax=unclassified Microcoleus TaxID=2642155 RepID=UPI001DFA3F11|nr:MULTISPECIES: alpha/beta hydrolase [unclassified Microcoleus]TAE80214.1 MAG: alpha/beta hydrolase [Oscillatoriales cyanobacterium]MCC3407687.1 alpha/beta hydrolase [Microcoleus sp. PH2017_10_PVI_O_A]MCC3461895.1 alpha/beta hydrolase [Microcoleus sp. PH2017_11_PCY_U_A]MCC3480281.1 alpha/beta hydrolase [Microcoleus sp. PH2017_12_PCY_D_A]MCC3529638.1 alpha/beta hydrolase [Microcoleus sp. PH2017_21_RUC_O_A]
MANSNKKNMKLLLFGEFSLQRVLSSIIFIYAFLCLYAVFFSDRLIFQPPAAGYQDTREIIKLSSANGMKISAVHFPNPQAQYTILYSHGNAEDLGYIWSVLRDIRDSGFAVFAYDYQGYGTSEGKPSEYNVYGDIDAAYGYLTEQLRVPPKQIILYGRSVGGGPAVDLASRQSVGGLVVESSFVSVFRVLTRIPLFPIDKFVNVDKIGKVRSPVLVIHGKADRVVPFWHSEQLFAAAKQPKLNFWVDRAGHNDLMEVAGDRYATTLRRFVRAIGN